MHSSSCSKYLTIYIAQVPPLSGHMCPDIIEIWFHTDIFGSGISSKPCPEGLVRTPAGFGAPEGYERAGLVCLG